MAGFYYIGLAEDSTPRAIRFHDYASGETKDVAPVPGAISIGLSGRARRPRAAVCSRGRSAGSRHLVDRLRSLDRIGSV